MEIRLVAGKVLSRRVSEFLGVVLFGAALVSLIALATYDVDDAVWFFNTGGETPPANLAGRVGALLAEVAHQLIGYASLLIPVTLAVVGWRAFWCRPIDAVYTKLLGLGLVFGCSASFLSLTTGRSGDPAAAVDAGGYLGSVLAAFLAAYFNRTGSIVVILTILCLSVILSTQLSLGRVFATVWRSASGVIQAAGSAARRWWTRRQKARQRQGVVNKHLAKTAGPSARTEILAKSRAPESGAALLEDPAGHRAASRNGKRAPQTPAAGDPAGAITLDAPPAIAAPSAAAEPKLPLGPDLSMQERRSSYSRPPVALLDSPKAAEKVDERQLMDSAHLLQHKCREFSVEGSVAQIQPGPIVTTFEFKPDPGVKYSKVTGLADDLCLAMRAESVLIERIPGKSTVGIQIPNPIRHQISLRELLESPSYVRSPSKLTLALGKTIHGEPVVSDLAKMPHLLIAGATGTGKSVSLNAMLTSILYRATPEDVRLILIDPKRLELGMYADIPHLLTPVVVDPKQANNALRWAVREMEQRYKHLAAEGVRHIEQYNRNVRQLLEEEQRKPGHKKGDDGKDASLPSPLPYVVLAIDELADLMMVASKEVEESIARLAQMARAVGIHLILATQRPSVDVITGLIKANLPSRIAFRVSSKVDSRTILDSNGAEQLLGKGDMLFLAPASSRGLRLHGPYISERETARLCSFLRKQGKPGYDESITADDAPVDAIPLERDDLYDQAARIIVSSGQASISYLQRRLRIGFSRAARLVDMMEADGLVSSGASGKPREVLVAPGYFEEVDAHLR